MWMMWRLWSAVFSGLICNVIWRTGWCWEQIQERPPVKWSLTRCVPRSTTLLLTSSEEAATETLAGVFSSCGPVLTEYLRFCPVCPAVVVVQVQRQTHRRPQIFCPPTWPSSLWTAGGSLVWSWPSTYCRTHSTGRCCKPRRQLALLGFNQTV